MTRFLARRLLNYAVLLMLASFLTFGLTSLTFHPLDSLMQRNPRPPQTVIDAKAAELDLDKPIPLRYAHWVSGAVRGDFGQSFLWNRPVSELIWERLGLTVAISLAALLFVWAVAFPVSVYAATHQYSFGDHLFSFFGFIGLGFPDFMVALILLWIGYRYFDTNLGGLFSDAFIEAPWGWPKFLDMLKHLWVPMVVLGMGGTAGLIRTTRANLLDELNKPYVELARAKGMNELKLIWKYPVRVALNPFFSTVGWSLANLISGATLISVVLSLQTTGPMQLRALTSQDMYLAGSFLLLLSALTVIGTLISDILLAWVDPRIRLER